MFHEFLGGFEDFLTNVTDLVDLWMSIFVFLDRFRVILNPLIADNTINVISVPSHVAFNFSLDSRGIFTNVTIFQFSQCQLPV